MSTNPPSQIKVSRRKMASQSRQSPTKNGSIYSAQDALGPLQDVLRRGVAAETTLWTFSTRDRVASIQAVDIDADGDREILVGSQDGYVRALTRWGTPKWERFLEGHAISVLYALPQGTAMEKQACIIVGTRSGQVIALDKSGERVPDWEYNTGRPIRQIYVSKQAPTHVIIGSEDRSIHLLDSVTGKPRCDKYQTEGWVRCVFAEDIDGDGRIEILAGSGDNYLYILDDQGNYLDRLSMGYQISALFAARLEPDGPMHIITTSNRKDLVAWTVSKRGKRWRHKKVWEKSPQEALFENRIRSITVADINNDRLPEILLGTEDGHLYILNYRGVPLWKKHFGECIYSIFASDIDFDGQVEILIGTEDRGARAFRLELTESFYLHIRAAHHNAKKIYSDSEITKVLSTRERKLLRDITEESTPLRPPGMQLEVVRRLIQEEAYEQALTLLLRLLQQRVQYYWSKPAETRGYIWSLCFGNVEDGPNCEIIAGTDKGYIHTFGIENGNDQQLWVKEIGDRIRMLQVGRFTPQEYDSIVAVLANHRLVMLNHQGEIVKEHIFDDKLDWARSISIHKSGDTQANTMSEIVIGQENKKVSIWDANLELPIATITTPQGINAVYTYNISGGDTDEIISGSIGNQVYVHTRQGDEVWRFETEGYIQALCVEDIDKDGYAEVIVGSTDRNVYVLDHEGHLKWRYRLGRNVMDVDVCDIKLENDPDDEQERKLKILVSSVDRYLYVLSADGDLLWKHRSKSRIRSLRARDVDYDGKYEIALASENQLELLQILNRQELFEYAQHCWQKLLNPDDYRGSLIQLTHHHDEYIRAFALAKLAGQLTRGVDDAKRFQEAIRDEDSFQVKRELVRSVAILYRVPANSEENRYLARQILQNLYTDPNQEIRLAIVDILPDLAPFDKKLCFDYLERFLGNVESWVRRAVVRQLDKLAMHYADAVFPLLKKTATDEDLWVRQETGRALAHYFDAHPQRLTCDIIALLYTATDAPLWQQISFSVKAPEAKHVLQVLVQLLTQLNAENVAGLLDLAADAIRVANRTGLLYGQVFLDVLEEFRHIIHTKTINAIARYQRITPSNIVEDSSRSITHIMCVLDALQRVAQIIKAYERREAIGDRVTSLLMALDALDKLHQELHLEEVRQIKKTGVHRLPENIILPSLLDQWSRIIRKELYTLRGDACLIAHIRNKVVPPEAEVVISLGIKNTGHSHAENVLIELEESADFEIIGYKQLSLVEVSSSYPAEVNFTIRPLSSAPRLSFRFTYDDAERRAKQERFADIVTIQAHQHSYNRIPNPYTSGTPIRGEEMFYGRLEDREALSDKLSSISTNKVVVLWGPRRVGKTSLLYQLAKDLSDGPYIPVLIDLQALSLTTDIVQLLTFFASSIAKEVQNYKHIVITEPDVEAFRSDPAAVFGEFLTYVLQEVKGHRLVFLLDEFEKFQSIIDQGILTPRILDYLRSLMQHRQHLSFLLAGASRTIRPLTEAYWSIFFNIALFHRLTKMKPDEATALITQPVSEFLEYDPLALERVRRLTGDQPYLIHVISEKLIAYCNKQKKSYLTINDVNTVLDVILDEQISSIQWIWKQADSVERLLLSILAQEKGQEGRIFTLNDIHETYDTLSIPYVGKTVKEALQNLIREDIVEESFNSTHYRIAIGLLKEWLRRTKPPEKVMREENLGCD